MLVRLAQLYVGLVLYGISASLLVLAGLGLDPWDVFHQGLSRTFGLAIGTWGATLSLSRVLCPAFSLAAALPPDPTSRREAPKRPR